MDDGTSRAGRRNAFGVIAGALFVIGPALAWLRIVPGIAGFGLFALGGMVGLVAGVASVVQAARGRGLGRGGALAVAVGAVFLALASRGVGVPRINDFTTDPTDPPAFTYAVTLPPNAGRDMSYPKAFADIGARARGRSGGLHARRGRGATDGPHGDPERAVRGAPRGDGDQPALRLPGRHRHPGPPGGRRHEPDRHALEVTRRAGRLRGERRPHQDLRPSGRGRWGAPSLNSREAPRIARRTSPTASSSRTWRARGSERRRVLRQHARSASDTLSDDWPDAGTSRPQWRTSVVSK